MQWRTSDRMLGACALGRDSECYSDKCTATNCVGHCGETLKQCVIIEKDGRVGQGISSDGDVGKGLCEQVVCKATSEVRVDISHKKVCRDKISRKRLSMYEVFMQKEIDLHDKLSESN